MQARSLVRPRLRAIERLSTEQEEWTWEELRYWLQHFKRLSPGTIEERIRGLKRLSRHPIMPVQIHGSQQDLVRSFFAFIQYREEVEQKGPNAVVNDNKHFRALAAFLGVPSEILPKAPTVPRRAREKLPTPEDIYDLLHWNGYAPNYRHNYEQQLVKYMLVLDMGYGVRFPSEAFSMRIDDFDPADHTLVVREPKKGGGTRRLLIEPEWLCCSSRHASLAQYLKWRDKVDVGGTDAFFLKPTGEPFPNKLALKRFLDKRVKPHFPWFQCYLGRRWTANARLIEWDYDYARVADWLGHESVDMVRRVYEHDARLHAKLYGKDWLRRAFQRPRTNSQRPRTL